MIYMSHMDYGNSQSRYVHNNDYNNRSAIYRHVDNDCDHYGNDFSKSQKRDFSNRYDGASLYMNHNSNNYDNHSNYNKNDNHNNYGNNGYNW
jgi:hypothetical protein